MSRPPLHVLFSPSGAQTLREVLAERGRAEAVACPFDDFSFGPLGRDEAARVAWVEAELGLSGWDDVTAKTAPFLAAACSDQVVPVAWISRRHARDYAGFLWWLSHLGDAPCKIIDITDRATAPEAIWQPASSPSALTQEEMAALLDGEIDLPGVERAAHRARWTALVAEDAPLRVVDSEGRLTSAPLDIFDSLLLSFATPEWKRPAWLVGHVLGSFLEDHIHPTGDLVLFGRVEVLAVAGALEWRGDLDRLMGWEVRLPN